jgi:succinyl-diaminopimelate desuccinylase
VTDVGAANAVRITPAEDLLALTAALVAIPSVSLAEADLAELVAERLADRASALTITTVGENVVARTNLGCDERVLFGGHLDTVPANGNEVPRVEGDVLYGLGSCDMKGGLAVLLRLAEAISEAIEAGTPPTRDVTVVWYAAEEIAEKYNGLPTILDGDVELLTADFAVLLEPTEAWIEAGCQGSMNATITVRGERAHSARPWMGENAIHKAASLIARLEAADPGTLEVDGLPFRQSLQVVRIAGGVANNVVPDECVITVNRRLAPGVQAEAVLSELWALCPEAESVELLNASTPAAPNLTNPLVAEFIATVHADVRPKLGWTDVARFTALGVPALNYGPGDPTIAHSAGEFVRRADLDAVYAGLAAFVGLGA